MNTIEKIRAELPDQEYRYLGGDLELRTGTKGLGIEGFIPFESESVEMMGFVEEIQPTAFDKTLKDRSNDIVSSWNHDPNWILGRRSNKTLKLGIGDDGLEYDVALDEDDPIHRHFARRVERRDIVGSSFTFNAVREEWTEASKKKPALRELLEIRLFEIGPVTYPAYPQSGAQKRQAICDVASAKIGDDADMAELGRAICRSSGGIAREEDVEIFNDWLRRIANYLSPELTAWQASAILRRRALRAVEERAGIS